MPLEQVDDVLQARHWFAEELRHTAHVRSPAVVVANSEPKCAVADPRRLCHNVLVAIDETRRLNNGQRAYGRACSTSWASRAATA
jgi:hypothetical protein